MKPGKEILPGTEVTVWDHRHERWERATVLMRYGYVAKDMMRILGWSYKTAQYPDCVDVEFHHDKRISKGHFTDGVRRE